MTVLMESSSTEIFLIFHHFSFQLGKELPRYFFEEHFPESRISVGP